MRFLVLLVISTLSLSLFADTESTVDLLLNKKRLNTDKTIVHYPILGDRATTVGHLKLNFDKMPGGAVGDPITMNALSLGLGDRVEFGLIPWIYAFDSNDFFKYGIVFKYNFYKSKEIQIAAGASQIKGGLKFDGGESSENGTSKYTGKADQWMNYSYLSINYTPIAKSYNFGLTIKYTELINSSSVNGIYDYKDPESGIELSVPINATNRKSDFDNSLTFDMNYFLKNNHWVGISLGTASINTRLNVDEESDLEGGIDSKERYVLGLSYIYRNKISFLTDPRFSVIYFEGSGLNYGFSTTF